MADIAVKNDGTQYQIGGVIYSLTLTGENIITLVGSDNSTSTITLPICTEEAIDTLFENTPQPTQNGVVIEFASQGQVWYTNHEYEPERQFGTLTPIEEEEDE